MAANHMTAPGSGTSPSEMGRPLGLPAVTPAPPPLRGDQRGRPLSRRELETLAAYARVGNQDEAAAVLGITRQTVKNYATQAYAKLGVTSANEAFHALGWLRVPPDSSIEYDYHLMLAAAAELREVLDRFADVMAKARREVAA